MKAGRVAVTSVGIVSSLGQSADVTFERLIRGERGFSSIDAFDTAGQRTSFAATVPEFDVAAWEAREALGPLSRSDALAMAALRDALGRVPGALEGGRVGVAVGATTGGMFEAEEVLARYPDVPLSDVARERIAAYPISSTADRVSAAIGSAARVTTLCSACSSGASAIIQAALWIRTGDVDRAVAGGTDALCRLTLTGFNALGATDMVPCRPFDRQRSGLTLGEGAAFLVLESEERAVARGARVLAWLTGWSEGAEAHHITQPEPSARMPARLLEEAMRRGGIAPNRVDYLNAHGTGTSNDVVEAAAIREAFGAHAAELLVSSSKGQIGHTLGAAGAIEAAITVLAIDRQCAPPTGGLTEPDAECTLNHVVGRGREGRIRAALSSAFGFGGAGAVLLFEEASAEARVSGASSDGTCRLVVSALAAAGPKGAATGAHAEEALEVPRDGGSARPLESLEASRSRRFDVQTALVTVAAGEVLSAAGLDPRGVGLVAGAAFGSVERTSAFLRASIEKGPRRAPPAEFPHLLPSSSPGNASIYLGLTGPVMTVSNLDASVLAAVLVACDLVEADVASHMVAGGSVVRDAFTRDVLGAACGAKAQGLADLSCFLLLEREDDARGRGARPLAALVGRDEAAAGVDVSLRIRPPKVPERALVVTYDDPRSAAVAERAGWRAAPCLRVAGAAGEGIAAALARIVRGEAREALVLEWTPSRVLALHLVEAS